MWSPGEDTALSPGTAPSWLRSATLAPLAPDVECVPGGEPASAPCALGPLSPHKAPDGQKVLRVTFRNTELTSRLHKGRVQDVLAKADKCWASAGSAAAHLKWLWTEQTRREKLRVR